MVWFVKDQGLASIITCQGCLEHITSNNSDSVLSLSGLNPGRFGPVPVRSGRFRPGRFGPISGVSRFCPVGAGHFGPIS